MLWIQHKQSQFIFYILKWKLEKGCLSQRLLVRWRKEKLLSELFLQNQQSHSWYFSFHLPCCCNILIRILFSFTVELYCGLIIGTNFFFLFNFVELFKVINSTATWNEARYTWQNDHFILNIFKCCKWVIKENSADYHAEKDSALLGS